MKDRSFHRSRRPTAGPVVAACIAVFVAAAPAASGAKQAPAPPSRAQEAAQDVLSCERVAGRCVGIQQALPFEGPVRPSPPVTLGASTQDSPLDAVPVTAGPACPGPALPEPTRDDWCERWVTKRGLGPQGVGEVPYAAAPSPDGSELYVLAYAATSDILGAAILVFDTADGSWRRTLPLPYRFLGPQSEFYPSHVVAASDGIFVAGFVRVRVETPEGFERHANFLTAAFDPEGELRWWSRYQGPMSGQGADHLDVPNSLVLSPDGSQVIVAGASTRPGPYQPDPRFFNRTVPPDDVAIVSYDAVTGTQRWIQRHDTGKLEFPYGVAMGPDGKDLYVNTMSWRFESTVLAYSGLADDDGPRLEWSHAEDPSDFLAPIAISATSAGVVITGISLANASNTIDYGALALDPVGGVRWRANHSNIYTIAGTEYTSTDLPMAMAADDDRVYITGYAYEWDAPYALGDPSPAMVPSTVAFDADDGSLEWARTYRFPGHRIHFPFNLHLAGDRVYVPGLDSECNWYVIDPSYYCKSTIINLVTLDYAASTGTLQRVARFNHARSPGAAGVQPSPPTAPGFNIIGPSVAGPRDRLHITGLFDSPCVECHSAERFRLGIVAYEPDS